MSEPKKRVRVGHFFTGGILSREEFTRRLPVLVYVVFLMLLYIANGFHTQRKHGRLERVTDQIMRLKTISVTTSAVRMTATRQSEIQRLLHERNVPLVQPSTAPRRIEEP